jgi:hypothetical protein
MEILDTSCPEGSNLIRIDPPLCDSGDICSLSVVSPCTAEKQFAKRCLLITKERQPLVWRNNAVIRSECWIALLN